MNPDPKRWGIELEYLDVRKKRHEASPETVEAILDAMGASGEGPEGDETAPLVITKGDVFDVGGEWSVVLEDGGGRQGNGLLPKDLGIGYHRLSTETGERRLIIAPEHSLSFEGIRQWGWAVQLYSMRSQQSWGIGDLGDLKKFGSLVKSQEASFALLNPLHASIPGEPQQTSPYYPSSRQFRNPLYIDIAQVHGAETLDQDLVIAAHAMNNNRRIDRDAVWQKKITALEVLWSRARKDDAGFRAYLERQGEALKRYATYCVLREKFGILWSEWPASYRHPSSTEVARLAVEENDRVSFHQWLQWLLDVQLEKASNAIDLINDLAIGVDPAGADAWLWQDAFALDVRVGAPPDEFNQRGQDWGLPPFDPWRLRKLEYEPFIRTMRAALTHATGIRIDHVMGLFRLFWIPKGASAREGTYVKYPYKDLLGIVSLEAVRAGARVIGEDLGTVERYMRDELRTRNIASYKVLWFEEDLPSSYPELSLGAVTTHDLPTVAGLWSGSDLELQEKLGIEPNVESTLAIRERVKEMASLDEDAPVTEAVDGCHQLLASASSALVSVTLEDALRVAERPNYPGTTSEWPNWSVALPEAVENFAGDEGFTSTARTMRGRFG